MHINILFMVLIIKCVSGYNYERNLQGRTFPKDFLFGVATSAHQIEGAWNASGKTESNWDHFAHTQPHKIMDGNNADIACDSYHKIKEDVKLIKELGVNFYKFSLSWTRILPDPFNNKVNPDGIRYYNELIDTLLDNNIEPVVTLFHFDLPQQLQLLGGFTNSEITKYFVKYANVAFESFGDRIKIWTTLNQPHIFCLLGYGQDSTAPAYNLSGIGEYLCCYNALKAHAEVYHLYNDKFRSTQHGKISIIVDSAWFEPGSSSSEDIEASERAIQFDLGLFAHPIYSEEGDYPKIVKDTIAKRSLQEGYEQTRLPQFTQHEIKRIQGTHDGILCFNHYSTKMVKNKKPDPIDIPSYEKDRNIDLYYDPSWPPTAFPVHKVVPWGLKKVLVWIKKNYGNQTIYITENGYSDNGELDDQGRISYHKSYLSSLLEAMYDHGVRVERYTAWSLMDNFEWSYGYTQIFGLYQVDFKDPKRPRKAKSSVGYYKRVILTRKP